jgi:hypothetical protein
MARIPRNVRNLNPGNLMPPTEAEGYDWWSGYTGSDPGGFAQFKDAKSGINALLQQIRIDKGRKLTLRKFIEKYVGKTADPEGTANALRNIPQILGARLDTLLTEIPSDSLARAITQSEGGAAAADTFKIPSTEEEIDLGVVAEELRGPASDVPLVYRMDQREEKPSRADVEKKPFIGPRQRDLGPLLDPLPLKDVFTSEEDKFVGPEPSLDKEFELFKKGAVPKIMPTPGYGAELFRPSKDIDIQTQAEAKEDQFIGPRQQDKKFELFKKGRDIDIQTQAEAGGPSFLSRLGGAIKDNPMIAAQIAQVVGGIGSGVLGGRRMAKEQAKGARRQREAMNMANAISTLTRGRTQPAVAPRPVISKPGGAETIFDILGTLGQGGAQITQGIQQREEAAEDRRRQQEMEDFQKAYMTRGQDIEQFEVERGIQDDLAKVAEDEAKRAMAEFEKNNEGTLEPADRQELVAYLDRLEELFYKGNFTQTGYFAFEQQWGKGGEIQGDFDSVISMMFGAMNKLMDLGRMSDKDVELIKKALPDRNDAAGRVRGRIRGIKFALDTMTGAAAPGGVPQGGKYAKMSPAELADYLDENTDDQGEFTGDPEALKELEDREKNVSALSLGT